MSHYRGSGYSYGGGGGGGYSNNRGRDDSRNNDYDSRDRSRSRDTAYDRESSRYGGSSYGGSSYGGGGGGSSYRGSNDSRSGSGYGDRSNSSHSYGPPAGGMPGGSGRGGGGRGGGGGGARYASGPRPTEITVRTNYFPLKIPEKLILYQYQVEIKRAAVLRSPPREQTDTPPLGGDASPQADGKARPIQTENGRWIVPLTARDGQEKAALKIENSTPLSRRILAEALADAQNALPPVASDGGSLILSFAPIPAEKMILPIRTSPDCDADDQFVDISKKEWFIVTLTQTGIIDFAEFNRRGTAQDKFRQGLDVIIKNSLGRIGLKTFGKSPKVFYFDDRLQPELLGNTLRNMYQNMNNRFMPWVGVSQTTKFGLDKAFIAIDAKIDYMDREGIPLINERLGTVVGVRVGDLHRPIHTSQHREITDALDKITFHVHYKRFLSKEVKDRLASKGISPDKIAKMHFVVRRNKRMTKDTQRGVGILWAADDPDEYFFEQRPRKGEPEDTPVKRHTIASYFQEVYGIKLNYPKMPIVFIGKKEWYPMEFLTQALAKTSGANSGEQVKGVLGYYDEFGGLGQVPEKGCVGNIANLSRKANIDHELRRFNLDREKEPVTLKAKVLPEPKLIFSRNESASINNGSWDLRNKKFAKPAGIRAFAVVDFSPGARSMAYVKNLLKVCGDHGIMTQIDIRDDQTIRALTTAGADTSPDSIVSAFGQAVETAKNVFFRDTESIFRRNHVFFKTRVLRDHKVYDALVIPPPSQEFYGQVAIILKSDVYGPTHKNGEVSLRMMVKVQGKKDLVDPFVFEYDAVERSHKVGGERVTFERFVYVDNAMKEHEENGCSFEPAQVIPEYLLEDPVILVYLRDKGTSTYNQVKMASWHVYGVPSACSVHSNYDGQRNRDQYCSNIALKLNAKLSTCLDQARAWLTSDGIHESIPWVREVPTLVLGISVSHGFGSFGSKSVISATVAMDPGCMVFAQNVRVQSKAELINERVLRDLLMPLLIEFKKRVSVLPERIVVYRDGVSEGSSSRIKMREIQTIRYTYHDFLRCQDRDFSCTCDLKGCHACCPPITFIACLMQHNIKICPASLGDAVKNNVPSGTCVDHTIVNFSELSLSDDDRNSALLAGRLFPNADDNPSSFDFILTAHGGLKGTSKPVYYRVLQNDNLFIKPLGSDNGTPLTRLELETMTYHMSFQYGTATKAVRTVPVLYYSSRLANVIMGYIRTLMDRQLIRNEVLDEDDSNKPRNRFGELQDMEMFVRNDLVNEEGIELPTYAKSDLLPKFTLGIRDVRNAEPGQPFYCHLAA